ncbi:MAG TPA: type II/IV secretion system protein [Planctomycetes bacterium]|nr:type II/IV secretion system protein [Planctomycetota bacterium]
MSYPICEFVEREFSGLDPADPQYAVRVVDRILEEGRRRGASDVHLQPAPDGLDLKLRIDGVLQPCGRFPQRVAANIVGRLKVLADLLTYRVDVPQEGRIRAVEQDVEMRVTTFPTLHGERAVVRLFGGSQRYRRLDDLGLPEDILTTLRRLLRATSGAILVTGPAGSGKTTTVYACLRELARDAEPQRSLVSVEDPIEVAVEGVSQSQIDPKVDLDLATAIRFMLRQDPEVIMVGEIRDRATAEAAFGASLTGHLLLTTFHAGSAAEGIGRLLDMGIEPYLLRSGLLAIVCQRLLRALCCCAELTDAPEARLGLPVGAVCVPAGCEVCAGTGYQGRFVVAEMLVPERTELGRAILSRSDAARLEQLAIQAGMVTRWERACEAVRAGKTSPAEVRRVLGFNDPPPIGGVSQG